MGGESEEACGTCASYSHMGRRAFLGLLTIGVAGVAASSVPLDDADADTVTGSVRAATARRGVPAPQVPRLDVPPPVPLDEIPRPHPGRPQTITKAQGSPRTIAITIDDGTCAQCVDAYVGFALRTGTHITFSPNGKYGMWDPHAGTLRPLIEAGQVQIINHSFSHPDLRRASTATVHDEIERNGDWIEKTFGITPRPWFRPPYGSHDARTDGIAGQLGYTNIVMWNGSFGDSGPISPAQLMALANEYVQPGTIMLGHANEPTIIPLMDRITALIDERGLRPLTLDEMFGTSRRVG